MTPLLLIMPWLNWTIVGLLLTGLLETNFNEIWIKTQQFSYDKMILKMLSAKWQPFCLSLNVLKVPIFFSSVHVRNTSAGIILRMGSATERRRYSVTPPLIGWAHTQNDTYSSNLSSWTKDVQVWWYKTRILVSLLFVLHIIAMPMSIIKSLTSPLFAQQFVQAINKENIQIPYYWPHVKGIPQWLVDSPHKGPVMRTSGSMESIIMCQHALRKLRPQQNCNFADNIFFYWI